MCLAHPFEPSLLLPGGSKGQCVCMGVMLTILDLQHPLIQPSFLLLATRNSQVAAEAMRLCEQIILVLRPRITSASSSNALAAVPGDLKELVPQLFSALRGRLAAPDQVRPHACTHVCMCTCVYVYLFGCVYACEIAFKTCVLSSCIY